LKSSISPCLSRPLPLVDDPFGIVSTLGSILYICSGRYLTRLGNINTFPCWIDIRNRDLEGIYLFEGASQIVFEN